MCRVLIASILVLTAPAAIAQPYVGKWAETADSKCSEPLLLTATTMEVIGDDSWQCSFPAGGEGRSWTMRMKCAMEGESYRQTQTWTLSSDKLGDQRLTVKNAKGTFLYRRCGLSKKGAASR